MIKLPKSNSTNSKLGKGVRATYREVGPTCPQTCQHLKSKACYAMYGFVNIHASKAGYDLSDADQIYSWLLELPRDMKVRHHVSGDFMHPDGGVDNDYLDCMLAAHKQRPDLQGWSYTHAWQRIKNTKINSTKSLTVNASCDTIKDVQRALKSGWPATVVVDENAESGPLELDGIKSKLVICPAQTHNVKCSDCMLCFRKNRACVVGFRVHGTGKSKFSDLLSDNSKDPNTP